MEPLRSLFSCFIPYIQPSKSNFNQSDTSENNNPSFYREEFQKTLTPYEKLKKNDDYEEKLNQSLIEAVMRYRTYNMDSMPLDEVRLIAGEIFKIYKPNLKNDLIKNAGQLEARLIYTHLSTQSLNFRFAMSEIFHAYWEDVKEKKGLIPENAYIASCLGCSKAEFKDFKKRLSKSKNQH